MTKMWNEILQQPEVISGCLEKNRGKIRSLTEEIRKKGIKHIVLAARGTSDHAAVYGKYIFEMLLGIPVSLSASSIFTIYNGKVNYDKCLVIGISQSGRALDVLEVLKHAEGYDSITVGITNNNDSEIAKGVQHHIYCEAGVEESVAATKTFTAQMIILAMLAAEWSEKPGLMEKLAAIPGGMNKIVMQSALMEEKVIRYCFMNECFVLARGINYAIALEAALKIQETNYTRAKAFATSDFQHGPIAMIDRNIPVFVFAPSGPSYNDVYGMITKLAEQGMELIIASNKREALEKAATSLEIPETEDDMISPFYNVMLAQMFACRLSESKGLNPDSPRGLNKVTITK